MSNSSTGTGSGATNGSRWVLSVRRIGGFRSVVLIILAVVLLIIATSVWNSWRAAYTEQAEDQVAVLRELSSAAVSAANDADRAIYGKLNADKVLLDKIRAEQSAESKATDDAATALRLKSENSGAAKKAEETAKVSRAAANEAKKQRIKAETDAARALAAVVAAKKSLQSSEAEIALAFRSPHSAAFIVLSLLLVSIFPLSAIAFMWLEVPSLLTQLDVDSRMLGSQRHAFTSTGSGDSNLIGHRWNGFSYSLHCGLAVFATAVGAALFFRTKDELLDVNTLRGMQLGFLGAYVYCLNLVYRRYTTRDLAPYVYLSCAVGLIAGMAFNYVAFTAITNIAATGSLPAEFTGVGAGASAILAFSLGFFPNLAIRWFGRLSRTSVHERQRRSDALPLALIDGISELHESRLRDEGIDNVQNLAAADIQDLVEKTPYTAQEIVEWVDQAVLYLYVDPSETESFRRAGVRSVSDFRDIWDGFSVRYKLQPDGRIKRVPIVVDDADFDERRKSIAQQLATTEQRLDCLFRATEEGPNMEHVRTYWINVQNAAIETRNLLINQVCGRIGRTLRESARDGDNLTPDEILKQVAEELFLVTPNNADITAESLYGQAYLKNKLGRIAEARELFEQCTLRFPEDPVAFNDLAWLDLQTRSQRSAFETARTNALRAVALAEAQNLSDLASYRDTLALAEIRLGNVETGVKEIKKGIEKWAGLGRGPEPRFLETLMSAAEAYLAKGNREQAQVVLDFVLAENYANAKTAERIAEMQQVLAAPAGE